jgi:addiction module HigA family antidote
MKMHNPRHSVQVLRALCLEPLNLTVTDAARSLGVSRKVLSSILNGRAGISPEMVVSLSIAFNTSAESWLNQQLQYDLSHAEKKSETARSDEVVYHCLSLRAVRQAGHAAK